MHTYETEAAPTARPGAADRELGGSVIGMKAVDLGGAVGVGEERVVHALRG